MICIVCYYGFMYFVVSSLFSYPFYCMLCLRSHAGVCEKNTSSREDIWQGRLSEHQVRGWGAVSAAGLVLPFCRSLQGSVSAAVCSFPLPKIGSVSAAVCRDRRAKALPEIVHFSQALVCASSRHRNQRSAAIAWLRTNAVNINGAAKVMNFDRLGKKVRPGTFGNIQVG